MILNLIMKGKNNSDLIKNGKNNNGRSNDFS